MDHKDDFNDFIDEVYGTVEIAGITFDASRILEELDPIAYRCMYADWEDEYIEEEDEEEEMA